MIAFDAFAGIGGFHEAIHGSPSLREIRVAIACDSDPVCKAVYMRARESVKHFVDDIFEIGTNAREGIDLKRIDVLTAGFPCQPFANVGKRGGLRDPRAETFSYLIEILRTYRPKYAVLENVQKLSSFDRGSTFSAIMEALRGAGYHVEPLDLCASDFGVPQQRRRLYFVCVALPLRQRTSVRRPAVRRRRARFPTTWHLLERSMPQLHLVPDRTRDTVFRRNVRWQGDLYIDRAIARPICASMGKWHRANQDNYFSSSYVFGAAPDRAHRGREFRFGEAVRRITPLEGLRLQGFPDRYVAAFADIAPSVAYRLIGNAVAVPVARSVLEWALEAF